MTFSVIECNGGLEADISSALSLTGQVVIVHPWAISGNQFFSYWYWSTAWNSPTPFQNIGRQTDWQWISFTNFLSFPFTFRKNRTRSTSLLLSPSLPSYSPTTDLDVHTQISVLRLNSVVREIVYFLRAKFTSPGVVRYVLHSLK